MKKHGSTCIFKDERLADLRRNLGRLIMEGACTNSAELYRRLVDSPARRFYISSERALRVVKKLISGVDVTAVMLPSKQEMFREIMRRVMKETAARPGVSLESAVFHVVNSRAPKFYMAPATAQEYLYRKNRHKHYEKHTS